MKLLDRGKFAFQDFSSEDLLSVSTLKTKLSNNSNKINKIIMIIIKIIMIIIIIITITNLKWNEKKPIKSLDQHNTHKFLGVFENTKREDKQVLEAAAKTYLQRLSIIWSSPLSDHAKVVASNQYALPALTYLMRTQIWPTANIQQLDREGRKIIVKNGGNHPQGIDSDTLHV